MERDQMKFYKIKFKNREFFHRDGWVSKYFHGEKLYPVMRAHAAMFSEGFLNELEKDIFPEDTFEKVLLTDEREIYYAVNRFVLPSESLDFRDFVARYRKTQ